MLLLHPPRRCLCKKRRETATVTMLTKRKLICPKRNKPQATSWQASAVCKLEDASATFFALMCIFSEMGVAAKPVLVVLVWKYSESLSEMGEAQCSIRFWHEEHKLAFIAGEAQYVRTSVALDVLVTMGALLCLQLLAVDDKIQQLDGLLVE